MVKKFPIAHKIVERLLPAKPLLGLSAGIVSTLKTNFNLQIKPSTLTDLMAVYSDHYGYGRVIMLLNPSWSNSITVNSLIQNRDTLEEWTNYTSLKDIDALLQLLEINSVTNYYKVNEFTFNLLKDLIDGKV